MAIPRYNIGLNENILKLKTKMKLKTEKNGRTDCPMTFFDFFLLFLSIETSREYAHGQ